jgi:hypothetical protein
VNGAQGSAPLATAIRLFRRSAVPVVAMVAGGGLLSSTTSSAGNARYYPYFLTVIVFALSVADLATDRSRNAAGATAPLASVRQLIVANARGLGVAALVIALWLVIPWLGFFTSATLMLTLSACLLGVGLLRAIAFAVVIAILAYLLFVQVVAISPPTGLFY